MPRDVNGRSPPLAAPVNPATSEALPQPFSSCFGNYPGLGMSLHVCIEVKTHPKTLTPSQSLPSERSEGANIALSETPVYDAVSGDCPAQQLRAARSHDQPTEPEDPVHRARLSPIQEVDVHRVLIGTGAFSQVYRTLDRVGRNLAVKVVHLRQQCSTDQALFAFRREVEALDGLSHENIIEYLGVGGWNTDTPQIFMPLREGNLASLARDETRQCNLDTLCMQFLEQMLSALDYLAFKGLCHRDVKPENILYSTQSPGLYRFQLADFGLVSHHQLAATLCGTRYYQAPELYNAHGQRWQSPKMDVWSLFVAILVVHPNFNFPPPDARDYTDVLRAVLAEAAKTPKLNAMARENPERRASAAQMLVALYDGRGLSTPREQVQPISPADGL